VTCRPHGDLNVAAAERFEWVLDQHLWALRLLRPTSRRCQVKTIEESIEIDVPVSTAYNQWTQFESFAAFMEGVERVEQKDDTHLHWVAEVGGQKHEWEA
jgi:uncharacterized membrane protein